MGYKKHEVEEVYIAPKNEKKKKEKGNKSENPNSTAVIKKVFNNNYCSVNIRLDVKFVIQKY